MESQVSPKNIEARVEAMAVAEKPPVESPEVKPEIKSEVKPPEVKPEVKAPTEKPEVRSEVKIEVKPPEVKPEAKTEKKQPNDPSELRKWSTKLSQENATLREEMRAIKAAIEKMSKKPVDYAALSKDPEALRKHIDSERQEAVAELQQQLTEKHNAAIKNETVVERMKREQDVENYPRWTKLFPLIQTLAANGDGRINWNQAPGDALDEAYTLANQLSPVDAVVPSPEVPAVEVKASVPAVKTPEQIEAEIQTRIADAKKQAFADAQEALRNEQNGGGVGSAGKGGRRDNKVSKEALMKMDRSELKKLISQE